MYLTELLFNNDGLTQESLTQILHMDKANTARALKALESEGYVERTEDLNDLRKKRVYVTKKSRMFEAEFHMVFKDLNKVLVKDFTDDEKEIFLDLLHRMADNIMSERAGKDE